MPCPYSQVNGKVSNLQLWKHAFEYATENIVIGVSRLRGPCTAVGRNVMTMDLQVSLASE